MLQVPAGLEGQFNWVDYLALNSNSKAAPVNIFPVRDNQKHSFKVHKSSIYFVVVDEGGRIILLQVLVPYDPSCPSSAPK